MFYSLPSFLSVAVRTLQAKRGYSDLLSPRQQVSKEKGRTIEQAFRQEQIKRGRMAEAYRPPLLACIVLGALLCGGRFLSHGEQLPDPESSQSKPRIHKTKAHLTKKGLRTVLGFGGGLGKYTELMNLYIKWMFL